MSRKTNTDRRTDWLITPNNRVFDPGAPHLFSYRYLLSRLIHRDVTAFYKQTILGPLWLIIQPLLSTAVFTLIFGKLIKVPVDNIPSPLFYLSGLILWNYFSECLNRTSGVFKDNAILFGKVYFPRLLVPISITISLLFRYAIQLLLFLLIESLLWFNGYFHFQYNWLMILFPILTLLMAILGLGLGLIIAALTVKYKDLNLLISFGIQLLMYVTPVIYPLSAAHPNLRWIISINPMTPLIETFRLAFLGSGSFSWIQLGQSAAICNIILFMGIVIFGKTEKNFIDHI